MRTLPCVSVLVLAFTAMGGASASSQTTSATSARTREILASFSKNKHVVRERRGERREKYKDVRSVASVPTDLQRLSGTYETPDFGLVLRLRVDAAGRVEGTGEEPVRDGVKRTFTLANGRISGAMLTATKIFATGRRESVEGVFMNRTSRESPTDPGVTEFGLGVIGTPIQISGLTVDKFFYRKTN